MIPHSWTPIPTHLAQSTLCALFAGLLTLALRKNQARVRAWIWIAASCKFLLPFSLLIVLGGQVRERTVPAATASHIVQAIDRASRPFVDAPSPFPESSPAPSAADKWPEILWTVWGCGFLAIASSWCIRWRRIRAAIRQATPIPLDAPIPALSAHSFLEPGVFGVFRPVLLLPETIFERLTPAQLKAVIAHELCHVRHRDNLVSMVQSFVEAVFWFHPLVWWIGHRIVEERERACDEEVLLLTSEPRHYAEALLNVCRLYVEAPAACVSGVTGGNLTRRIQAILTNEGSLRLHLRKKLLLLAAAVLVASTPLLIGFGKAQTTKGPEFEVASLKPGSPGRLIIFPSRRGGRFSWTAFLPEFLSYAYHIPGWRISGAQQYHALYSVDATLDASASEDDVRLMLQALFINRCRLVAHRETRITQGWAMVVGPKGSKLQAAGANGEPPMPDFHRGWSSDAMAGRILTSVEEPGVWSMVARGVTTAQLAQEISANLSEFVWDETGLTGKYYFAFKFLSVRDPHDDANAAPLQSVLQEELGLKLQRQKGSGELLIIDHFEKPSEN